jgi:hypothetical protein
LSACLLLLCALPYIKGLGRMVVVVVVVVLLLLTPCGRRKADSCAASVQRKDQVCTTIINLDEEESNPKEKR